MVSILKIMLAGNLFQLVAGDRIILQNMVELEHDSLS